MLVHICCSVDSHFFISELKKMYPNDEIIGFFYDPNIHPRAEYELRFLDVKRSCDKLGIRLYKSAYEYGKWLTRVKGFEVEPEKGARCEICFAMRVEKCVNFALKIGANTITTTLLTSPKKSMSQLIEALQRECAKKSLKFIAPDFRKNGGTQRQFELAREQMLYHQNYCGCEFALMRQRAERGFIDELMSPITRQVLPGSIEARLKFYKNLIKLEKRGVKFRILREKFLNYRLLSAKVSANDEAIATHILFYSHFKNAKTQFLQDKNLSGAFENFKDEVIFWDFDFFNFVLSAKFRDYDEALAKFRALKTSENLGKNSNLHENLSLNSREISNSNLSENSAKISSKNKLNLAKISSEIQSNLSPNLAQISSEIQPNLSKNSAQIPRKKFQNFKQFLKKPLSVDAEISLRLRLFGAYHLSPIIICEKIPHGKIKITAKSEIYFDVREKIVKI